MNFLILQTLFITNFTSQNTRYSNIRKQVFDNIQTASQSEWIFIINILKVTSKIKFM